MTKFEHLNKVKLASSQNKKNEDEIIYNDKCLGFIELDCTLFEIAVQFNREVNLTSFQLSFSRTIEAVWISSLCPFLD